MANKSDSDEDSDSMDIDGEESDEDDNVGAEGGEDIVHQKMQPGNFDKVISLQQTGRHRLEPNETRDSQHRLGQNETRDSQHRLEQNETRDSQHCLEQNETRDSQHRLGQNETRDSQHRLGQNETRDSQHCLGQNETRDSQTIYDGEEERRTFRNIRNNLSNHLSNNSGFNCLHPPWFPECIPLNNGNDMVDIRTGERTQLDVLKPTQYDYRPSAIPYGNRRIVRPEDVENHENQQTCLFNHGRCQACEVSGVNSEEEREHSESMHSAGMFNRQLQNDKPD